MTNAEKFKEVFPNVEVNESQKGFVVLHFKTKFNGYEYQESLAVWNSTWLADYQGTPTIPLSVIEKITTEIEERATYEGIYLDRADVLAIIDKAVKECTHENIR